MKNTSNDIWFVYMILCVNDSLYTGIAKNVEKRFNVHLSGKGARYTKIYKPLKIVYQEKCESHSLALKRELEIKSYSKNKKIKLINIFYV